MSFILPTFRLPFVHHSFGIEVDNIKHTTIMSDRNEHIIRRIELRQIIDTLLRLLWEGIPASLLLRHSEEGFPSRSLLAFLGIRGMHIGEDATRAGKAKSGIENSRAWHWRWYGFPLSWTERTTMVAYIAAHEDKRVGGHTGKARDMTYGMAGHIKNIKAAVAKEVNGVIAANFNSFVELHFNHFTASEQESQAEMTF